MGDEIQIGQERESYAWVQNMRQIAGKQCLKLVSSGSHLMIMLDPMKLKQPDQAGN